MRWRKKFISSINKTKDQIKIIDLLTGMGETWSFVKKRFPDSHLSALDFSEGMLKNAEIKNRKSFKNQVKILHQDILDNDLTADSYDVVICAFGLKTFNDEQLGILAKETDRILKKGGEFSYIEVSEPSNFVLRQIYGLYLG